MKQTRFLLTTAAAALFFILRLPSGAVSRKPDAGFRRIFIRRPGLSCGGGGYFPYRQ